MKQILTTKVILTLAVILAVLLPNPAHYLKDFLIFVLIFMLTISIKKVSHEKLSKEKKWFVTTLVITSTILLSTLYILFSYVLVSNELYRNALIIYALMPPAVGIISLGYLYHVDMQENLYAEFLAYIASLIIIPLGTYIFLREVVSPTEILRVIALIIIVPYILSRFVKKLNIKESTTRLMVNICFGIVIYTIIGFNLETIMQNINDVLEVTLVFVIVRFGLLFLIYYTAKKYLNRNQTILLTLYGTLKNGAAATAVVLLVLGPQSTIPLAVEVLFFSFTLILLDYLFKQ